MALLVSPGLMALGGIGQGLSSFSDSYLAAKKQQALQQEQNAKTGLLKAQTGGLGYDIDQNGQVTQNAYGQQLQQARLGAAQASQSENALAKQQADEQLDYSSEMHDPNSNVTQLARNAAQDDISALKATKFGQAHPDILSGYENAADSGTGFDIKNYMNLAPVKNTLDTIRGEDVNQAKLDALALASQYRTNRFDETQNVNASKAGQAFESNPIIQKTKMTRNSLNRAEEGLTQTDTPVTGAMMNAYRQDIINGLTADNSATEGKVGRENKETLMEMLNSIGARADQITDVRKQEPQTVNNLLGVIRRTKADYQNAIEDQASDIYDSYQDSDNPKVLSTIKRKLQKYAPLRYQEEFGDEENETPTAAAPAPTTQPNQGLLPAQPQGNQANQPAALTDAQRQHIVNTVRQRRLRALNGVQQ